MTPNGPGLFKTVKDALNVIQRIIRNDRYDIYNTPYGLSLPDYMYAIFCVNVMGLMTEV